MKRKVSLWVVCVMVVQLIIGMMPVAAADTGASANDTVTSKATVSVTEAVYPSITNKVPASNANEVGLNTNLNIVFDQQVTKGSGNITITDQATNIPYEIIRVESSNAVKINGNIVTVTNKTLEANKRYYVTIDAGAFRNTPADGDLEFRGLSGTSWSFNTVRTIDMNPPIVTSYSPANGANVMSAPVLKLSFNKNVYKGNGNIKILDSSSNRIVDTISVQSDSVTVEGTSVISIKPTSGVLINNTSYYVNIDSGAITDQFYNPYAGILNNNTWMFRVASDTTKPYVLSQSPSNGSSSVSTGSPITLEFSEDVQLNASTVLIRPLNTSTGTITGRTTLNSDRRTVTITPNSNLNFSTLYYIEIPSDFVRDYAGNSNDARTGTGYWSFTTTIQDRTAPVLQSTKMYNNNAILLQYNEQLDSYSTPYTSNFTVSVNDETRGVSNVTVSGDRVYVYLQSGVAVGQNMRISYSPGARPIQDLANNKASGFSNQIVQNTVETTLPKITSGYVSGRTVALTFSDSINNISSYAYSQFTVTADGRTKSIASNNTYSGSTVYLTLDSAVDNGEVVQVSYTPGSYPLMGYYGTPISSFSNFYIRNSYDSKAPSLVSTSVSGDKLILTYNEGLDSSYVPMKSFFSVLVNDKPVYVTAISINQNTVELKLASSVTTGQTVTVSYAPGDPRLRDFNSNYAPAFNLVQVGVSVDTSNPYVKTASLNGDAITLNLSEKVTSASSLSSNVFSVRVNNTLSTLSGAALNSTGDVISIYLASAIPSGQTVTLSYTPGYYPLKNAKGNEMKAFTNMAVTYQSSGSTASGSSLLTTEQSYSPFANSLNLLKPENAKTSSDRSRLGKVINRYAIDKDKLKEAFTYVISNERSLNKMITFNVPTTERAATVVIPLQPLDDAVKQNKNTYMSIRYGDVTYTIPLKNLNASGISSSLNASSSDISLMLQIEKQDTNGSMIPIVSQLNGPGVQAITDPYEFHVSALISSQPSRMIDVPMLMEHSIKLNQSVNSDQTAAVRYDNSVGKISYVPTVFGKPGSVTYANITGNSNETYRVVSSSITYPDIQNHWAKNDITKLASKFVVEGRTGTSFVPNASITRAEFAVFVARALGLSGDKTAAAKYRDVSANTVMGAYIGAASKAGIIQGNTDGSFKPNDLITREQMALMVVRAMDSTGKGVTLTSDASALLQKFSDRNKISKGAQVAVAKALQTQIITGMTEKTFVPQGNATRAQAVVMLKRMMQAIQYID